MTESSQKHYIPRHLDEPMRVIIWTLDEVITFGLPLLVFYMAFNQMLVGCCVGLMCFLALKKLKVGEGRSHIFGLLYWYLPQLFPLAKTPPSYIRWYRG